jgi:hypothetical protein
MSPTLRSKIMAKEDAGKPESHRERAEARLAVLDGVGFDPSTSENAGVIASIAVAHAMLAIHDELSAIRKKYRSEDNPGPHTARAIEVHI